MNFIPESTQGVEVEHLDGVAWYRAPVPSHRHECWVQTRGNTGRMKVERCACGAIRQMGVPYWGERNSRTADPQGNIIEVPWWRTFYRWLKDQGTW